VANDKTTSKNHAFLTDIPVHGPDLLVEKVKLLWEALGMHFHHTVAKNYLQHFTGKSTRTAQKNSECSCTVLKICSAKHLQLTYYKISLSKHRQQLNNLVDEISNNTHILQSPRLVSITRF